MALTIASNRILSSFTSFSVTRRGFPLGPHTLGLFALGLPTRVCLLLRQGICFGFLAFMGPAYFWSADAVEITPVYAIHGPLFSGRLCLAKTTQGELGRARFAPYAARWGEAPYVVLER